MLSLNRDDHSTSGIGPPSITELERRLNNLGRVGVIQDVDYRKGVARVSLQNGEILTDWIPWMTLRAGSDSFWWAPEPGETVLINSLGGELHNGFILAVAFSDGNQIASRPSVARVTFADGTLIEYDRKAHRLKIDVAATDFVDPEETPDNNSEAADGPEPDSPALSGGELDVTTAEDGKLTLGRNLIIEAATAVFITAPIIHLNPSS